MKDKIIKAISYFFTVAAITGLLCLIGAGAILAVKAFVWALML